MRFEQRAIPDAPKDFETLVRRVAINLVNPLWSAWFQVDKALSRTDLDWAIGMFLSQNPTRTDWYRALLKPPTVEIEWRERQPFIVPHTIARWEMLANFFDVDTLLTFDLADKGLAGRDISVDLPGLENWRTLPWISDHELRRILGRGVSDLHVHVGGVRIAQALWRDLMEDRRDPRVLRALAEAYQQDPFAALVASEEESTREKTVPLRSEIETARKAWLDLVQSVSRRYDPDALVPVKSATWWTWTHRRLNYERWVLIGAWNNILHGTPSASETATAMHRYLGHKHRFFRIMRQPILDGTPGLRFFDDQYFQKAVPARRRAFTGALGSRLKSSPRRDLAPFADACMYLMESPHLRRLELRFAPWGTASDLVRLFKFWDRLVREIDADFRRWKQQPADIRFALHFVRSTKGSRAGKQQAPTETGRIMKELDLASARLRLALSRAGSEYQRVMTAVARIDVAGQERDTQIAQFVMHMRLLRGDAPMIEVLEGASDQRDPHPCRRWLRAWLKVRDRGKHIASLSQPSLGMTAHAGEDYTDILDGVAQIGVAVDYLALRAGDSLGHALALVAPHGGPASRPIRMIPRGARLDALCWLHDMLEQAGERFPDQLRIRGMIERSGHDIYSSCRTCPPGVHALAKFDDFIWVWKHKMLPLLSELKRATAVRRVMVTMEYEDDLLIRERDRPVELETPRLRLDEAIYQARQLLLDRIKRQRIVVEMNPASNLRISGATQLRHSPAVTLVRQSREDLLACINTDNPGVFGSRIENEYALLLQGLVEADVPQGEARDLLERARSVGMDLVYWPGYPGRPEGIDGSS
jgi:hypothetical protein